MGPKQSSQAGKNLAEEVRINTKSGSGSQDETINGPYSQDASLSNSFIRGPYAEGAQQTHGAEFSQAFRNAHGEARTRHQLSRQQQRIYNQWKKAHRRQIAQKRKKQELERAVIENQPNRNIQENQNQTQVNNQKPSVESIWSGLQKRLSFKTQSEIKADKQDELEEVEIGLTIQINELESLRVPLDITEHADLTTFTSAWLKDVIFKVVREKRLNMRSASHSKDSTDVPGSEDGLSQKQKKQRLDSALEPICLSTVYNETECIDFFLTQKHEMVATYLPMDAILKVNYATKEELEDEQSTKEVPTLRDFDFIKVLGTGGFATVYMVRKRTTGMLYAMKLVKKDGVKQDQVKFAQVYTERQILEQLKNPFLVQLHYAFVTTNYYCLVIDLCTGGELFYYLQKNQSLQLANAKLLFAEVLLSMEFLHNNNILYRDLKPENILVDERGHLRLTDFGLCRASFKQGRDRAMSFVGSPEYMSPDILLGSGYDYSVDYYTLGVLLYEMLVGLPPHYNEDKMQMYKDITMKEPVVPSVLQGPARDILVRLLQIEPEKRLGMGPGGIQEIKNHPFFGEIDWAAVNAKVPQPGRKRLPLEVNILESNFDRQYTRLPILINVAQEELIKINDPIQLRKQARIRCSSFTFKPKIRSKRQPRKSSIAKKNDRIKLHRQTTIVVSQLKDIFHQNTSIPMLSSQSQLGGSNCFLPKLTQKTRSQHIKRHLKQAIFPKSALFNIEGKPVLDQENERILQRQTNSNQLISRQTSDCKKDVSTHLQIPSVNQKRFDLFNGTSSPTFEIQLSMQGSANDFKNNQSILDVFTELSLVTEEEQKLRSSANPGQVPSQGRVGTKTPQDFSAAEKIQLCAYKKKLSPFTPIEGEKVGQQKGKKHGLSEYNRRGTEVGGNQQESAFNYRKETQGEEELDPQNENSCTELDIMHHKGDLNQNEQVLQEEVDEYMIKTVPTTTKTVGQRLTHYQPHPKVNPFISQHMQTFAQDERIQAQAQKTKAVNGCLTASRKLEHSEGYTPNINIEIEIEPSTTPVLFQKIDNENAFQSFHGYASFIAGHLNESQVVIEEARYPLDSEEFMSDDSSSVFYEDNDYGRNQESESLQQFGMDFIEEGSEQHDCQLSQSKIQVMNKMKSKKLKKRLSQKHFDHSEFMEDTPKDASQQVLQFQYGFSVEQQNQRPDQALNRVVHINSDMRNVAKHQSSQNISNLIAQSVKGMTPRVFSKVASQEKLPALPQSRAPFPRLQKQENQSFEQTRKLIRFTEKAAGVISERNRKFHKPQTLKNLEQKLLHADEDEENDMKEEEFDGPQQHQMMNMQMLLEKHTADQQLAYNSEMISINEFEEERKDLLDFVSTEKVDMSSEDSKHEKSPITIFISNRIDDISSPKQKTKMKILNSEFDPTNESKPMRESISSPIIINNDKEARRRIEEYLCVSRNKLSDPSQFHQNKKSNELKLGRVAKANTREGSKSPAGAKFKKLVNDNMFLTLTKGKTLASTQTVAKSMTQMTIKTHYLQESPPRRNLNKQQLKDLIPLASRLAGTKTSQNISIQLADYRQSSLTPSIVVQSDSPYKSVCKKSGHKFKALQSRRVSTKKTSTTQTNIHRSSAIGNNLEYGSSQKEGKNSSHQKQNTYTGSSQKTKKQNHGQSLTRLAVLNPSNTKSAQKTFSSGKTSIANLSSKLSKKLPCQPTLINTPVQKIEIGETQTWSLRVLQTSSALASGSEDFLSPKHRLGTSLQKGNSAQTIYPMSANHNGTLKETLYLRDYLSNRDRLATVSSHRSFHSQGKSAASNYGKTDFSKKTNPIVKNSETALLSFTPQTFNEKDKEAYDSWKEAPMRIKPNVLSVKTPVILPRSNSAVNRRSPQPPSSKRLLKKILPRSSIFDVVEDSKKPIMRENSDKYYTYGISMSPNIGLRKKYRLDGVLLQSDSPKLDLQLKVDDFNRKNSRVVTAEQKNTIKYTLPQFLVQQHLSIAELRERGTKEDKPDILLKKNYNLQLVPKEPLDSQNIDNSGPYEIDSDDEDELPLNGTRPQSNGADQLKGIQNFTPTMSPSALIDIYLFNADQSSHALQVHKQRTPFKNRLWQQHQGMVNETSVEVLKLDASEFTYSDQEITKSNLLSLRSEELLGDHQQIQYHKGLNSTFQYISMHGEIPQWHSKQGGVLSADNVCIIQEEQLSNNEGQHEMPVKIEPPESYPMSLPELKSLASRFLSDHHQQTEAQHLTAQLRRGSAVAPLTSNCLLSADSLASFGRTENNIHMQKLSHKANNMEERITIFDDRNANSDDNYLAIHNKMPLTKHPKQQSAAKGEPSQNQNGESFMSAIPSQKDQQNKYQPSKKTISQCSKTQSNRKSQPYKKKSKKGKFKTQHPNMKGSNTATTQNLPANFYSNMPITVQVTLADNSNEKELAQKPNALLGGRQFRKSQLSRSVSLQSKQSKDQSREHPSRAAMDSMKERKPNAMTILPLKDSVGLQKQGTFGQASNFITSMILKQNKPSQVHAGKRSVGNTSSKTTSRESSIPFQKTSIRPQSPSHHLIIPASGFPKKVSLNLQSNEMKSGKKFKVVNRTQTGTPMAAKNNSRVVLLKDLDNTQSARASYPQKIKEAEEQQRGSLNDKSKLTAGPQFKTRNIPMLQLTETRSNAQKSLHK